MGRELGARELRHGLLAEAVFNAYVGYTSAANAAEWAEKHPQANALFCEAQVLARELGYE